MHYKNYKDRGNDTPLKQAPLDLDEKPGCEMREVLGWGQSYEKLPKTSGTLSAILSWLGGKRR